MGTEIKWLPAVIDSALGSVQIAGASLSNVFALWRQKKVNMAREVLLTNIRQGDVDALQQDEFFSMLARFSRSVHEGQAKANLILLARLISGIGKKDKKSGKASTFFNYSQMLESLTEEEIEFLAESIKTGQISENEEIRQSLIFKGFLSSVSSSKVTTAPAAIFRSYDAFPNTAKIAADITQKQKNTSNTYDVNTTVTYSFSKKFSDLLSEYGNLWEDISKWAEDENAV